MTLLSLDELLEMVVRALYKQWYDAELIDQHSTIDALRFALADALSESSGGAPSVPDMEDAVLDFLDELAQLPSVQTLAGDELQRLPSMRTSLLRQRDPGAASLRGAPVKLTDLSEPRRGALAALLAASQPAVYVLSTMHYRERTPRSPFALAGATPENELIRTLGDVLEQLSNRWHELAPHVQEQVLQQIDQLGLSSVDFDADTELDQDEVRRVLEALEKVPDVLRLALPQFVAGKSDTPPGTHRSGGSGRGLAAGERLPGVMSTMRNAVFGEALEAIEEAPAMIAPMEDAGPSGENTVNFQSEVDFPAQVAPGREIPLLVRLVLPPPEAISFDATITFADPKQPEVIEVVLSAPGFSERTRDWTRLIKVFSDHDSQPAVFLLQAEAAAGIAVLTVDYNHRGRLVGSAKYEVEITDAPAADPGSARRVGVTAPLEPLPGDPPQPADVELRVLKEPHNNTLHFTLHSEDASLGYNRQEMGTVQLADDPRQFLASIFRRLSEFAAQATAHGDDTFLQDVQDEIVTIGEDLFEQLFPEALQTEYWQLQKRREEGRINSLLIVSDEPWIPWELIKPFFYNAETGDVYRDDFLASAFRMSRWLADRGLGAHLQIRAAELVAPALDLPYVQRECDYFESLTEQGLELGEILRTRRDFLDTTRNGVFQLMHVAAHGKFKPENADASPIILHNHEMVLPGDLAGARALALRQQRPLVFLNTCHSGQIDFTLTGLGGWAERMVNDIGVNAFVGTLWEVHDELAAEFAQMFYNTLRDDQTLGEAFHAARTHIRTLQPANPTWLAYTLYGDPNSKVQWGEAGGRQREIEIWEQ